MDKPKVPRPLSDAVLIPTPRSYDQRLQVIAFLEEHALISPLTATVERACLRVIHKMGERIHDHDDRDVPIENCPGCTDGPSKEYVAESVRAQVIAAREVLDRIEREGPNYEDPDR